MCRGEEEAATLTLQHQLQLKAKCGWPATASDCCFQLSLAESVRGVTKQHTCMQTTQLLGLNTSPLT